MVLTEVVVNDHSGEDTTVKFLCALGGSMYWVRGPLLMVRRVRMATEPGRFVWRPAVKG